MKDIKNWSDKRLMGKVKSSNQIAFSILYDRFWEEMYRKAFAVLRDQYKAENTVQEVWISIWERRDKIDNDNIQGYLFSALKFKIFNKFRNDKNKNTLISEFINNYEPHNKSNNIDDFINLTETQSIIDLSIEKLPKKCQEVFKLSRYSGLKNNEIAKKLSISKRTVETHISNALKQLKNNVALGIACVLSIL